jgi:hypothetical protein
MGVRLQDMKRKKGSAAAPHSIYYVYRVRRILFKRLNRKSQRKAYTWEGFSQALAHIGWPTGRIRKNLSPYRSAELS